MQKQFFFKLFFIVTFIVTFNGVFFAIPAGAGLLFTYSQLKMKDLDEMNAMVAEKIKESKKSYAGKVVPLKECLQAVFSRANDDGMITMVLSPLRAELERYDAFEKTMKDLSAEAINAMKNTRNFKPEVQITYAIFLENVISEFKPLLGDNGFEKKLIEKIALAKIELTEDSKKERKRRMLLERISPSEIADKELKIAEQERKIAELKIAEKEAVEAQKKVDEAAKAAPNVPSDP